jgi:chloramphenicol-sensitive protein RarD
MPKSTDNRGLMAIILAFAIWGLFPIYWKLLGSISPVELLYTRLILTAIACLALLPLRGSGHLFLAAWTEPRILVRTLLAAILLSANWFSFIWAVNSGNVLESSLGYFLCPIVSVLMGRFIEKESMSNRRWLAVFLAVAGVSTLILLAGRVPTAAIVIALTWSAYGLLKKRSQLGPVVGLGLETSLLSPFAALALLWLASRSPLTLTSITPGVTGILLVAGIFTAAPLLLFAYAAPRIRLSTIGMGQYIVPSSHFILAFIYGEKVSPIILVGFGLIWIGLILYAVPESKTKSI